MFSLSGVPKGTTTLQFHMVDLDVPTYNHGGGDVAYKGPILGAMWRSHQLFAAKSPSGSHSYQITVTAFSAGNAKLATATFMRKFPEK